MGVTTTTNSANTYVPIGTYTLATATQNVTFNSISGYTDLYLVVSNVKHSYAGTSSVFDTLLIFNGDTGTNYSMTQIVGNGTSASSGNNSNQPALGTNYHMASASAAAIITANIMNYSNSTTYKTVLIRDAGTVGNGVTAEVGLWRNTAAITSITVGVAATYTMSAGTTITLYGIKAA